MDRNIQGIGRKIKKKDMEYVNFQMEKSIKVSGRIILDMEKDIKLKEILLKKLFFDIIKRLVKKL